MPLEVRLIDAVLPSELKPDDLIPLSYTVETSGTGTNYVGGALRDPNASAKGLVILTMRTLDERGPGERITLSHTFSSLAEWYEGALGVPIPDTLEWTPLAGWFDVAAGVFHITDEGTLHSIPVRVPGVGIWEWIRAHPMEIAAASGGLMIGAAILTKK